MFDGIEEAGGIGGGGGHEDVEPGNVGADGFEGLGVVGPEAGAVGAGDGHEGDGRFPVAVGSPVHGADFGEEVVVGYGEKVGKLHEGDGAATGEGPAGGDPEDGVFGEGAVFDLGGKGLAESARESEYVAFGVFDVLAEEQGGGGGLELVVEGGAHGFEHAEVAGGVGTEVFCFLGGERAFGVEGGFGCGPFAGLLEGGFELAAGGGFDLVEGLGCVAEFE